MDRADWKHRTESEAQAEDKPWPINDGKNERNKAQENGAEEIRGTAGWGEVNTLSNGLNQSGNGVPNHPRRRVAGSSFP